MTQPPLTSTEVIAERVRHLVARKGWTAQQLVDALAKVGITWTRLIVANLFVKKPERRGRYVTVDELYALAYVLDVAPVDLLTPADGTERLAVTPTMSHPARLVRLWARGDVPLPGTDPAIYNAEAHARAAISYTLRSRHERDGDGAVREVEYNITFDEERSDG